MGEVDLTNVLDGFDKFFVLFFLSVRFKVLALERELGSVDLVFE